MKNLVVLLSLFLTFGHGFSPKLNKNEETKLISRATQNFGVNCKLNAFWENELSLGLEYLNASIYMRRDTVALHGFGKMFNKFWHDQLDHMNKIRTFIIKRGGYARTPGFIFKNDVSSMESYANETNIIYKFLDLEKRANYNLLELHEATQEGSQLERDCIAVNRNYGYPINLPNGQQPRDPMSAQFLDETFTTFKVKRIEFLSHLLQKLTRHIESTGSRQHLNQLGVHVIDNELKERFNAF